jgi:hypothetical protein
MAGGMSERIMQPGSATKNQTQPELQSSAEESSPPYLAGLEVFVQRGL